MSDKIKKIVIGVLVVAAIFAALLFRTLIEENDKEPKSDYFTDDPKDWISDNYRTDSKDDLTVDVRKATRTYGDFSGNKLELYYEGNRITLFYHGSYEGRLFDIEYVNWSVSETPLMRISPDIDPDDGIIDSFIIAKLEDGEYVFYVYLDEDWREQVEYTNVAWSDDLATGAMNIVPFEFNGAENGVYVNRVSGPTWLTARTNGGIFVGDLNRETFKETKMSNVRSTFIYVK